MKDFSGLKERNIVIVGLGVSGYWAAKWLASVGARVTVSELRNALELDPKTLDELVQMGVRLETGGHKESTLSKADMIVVSPGVPHDIAVLSKAREKGIWVTGELELASRFIEAPIVAVTGTNGKSTVTSMIGHALTRGGMNTYVGGNIGTPLSALLAQGLEPEVVVAEVSSFQLDTTETFCPRAAILLNITRDHLDRYSGFGQYVESKLRIFQNLGEGSCAIICDDDFILSGFDLGSGRRVFRYGLRPKRDRHAYVQKGSMVVRNGKSREYSLRDYKLKGLHNIQNLLAVGLVYNFFGLDPDQFQTAIGEFEPLAHRMEWVGQINGITFYNDSKATNVDAAVRAIEGLDRPIVLIAGGRHKGASYDPLAKAAKGHVKAVITIGEAADMIEKALSRSVSCYRADSMESAVNLAYEICTPGDIVLLSPACSSFDMFTDYRERGEIFKEAVRKIIYGEN